MRAEIREEIEKESCLYIERKEDGALLGGIWFGEDDLRHRVRSRCLSYYLGEQYARCGSAPPSARCLKATRSWSSWLRAFSPATEHLNGCCFPLASPMRAASDAACARMTVRRATICSFRFSGRNCSKEGGNTRPLPENQENNFEKIGIFCLRGPFAPPI